MGFRLKTSKRTKELFDLMGSSSSLKPYTLSRLAISFSLANSEPIDSYTNDDVNGMELQRSTVTGEYDVIYKALIELNLNRSITDDEFYPTYTKLHIDRGMELLYNRYQYSGTSLSKFLNMIINKGDVI